MLTSRHPALLGPVLEAIATAAPHAAVEIVDAEPVLGSALLGLDHLDGPDRPPRRCRRRGRRNLRVSLATRQDAHV